MGERKTAGRRRRAGAHLPGLSLIMCLALCSCLDDDGPLNEPPTADAGPDLTVNVSEPAVFDGSGSHDPDGDTLSCHWDFGDGTTGEGTVVQHGYSAGGTYGVTLTVADERGAEAFDVCTVYVNSRPTADLLAPASAGKNVAVTFDGSGSLDPDEDSLSWSWDFGDGATAEGMIVQHSYADSGTYTVTLTVSDPGGAQDVASDTITISNSAPSASLVADQTVIQPGETVTFDGTGSSDLDGDTLSYEWVLGASTVIGNEAIITYTFTESGNFQVTLTVTDDDANDPLSDAVASLIRVNSPPVAEAGPDQTVDLFTEMPVTFDASASYDPDGGGLAYYWDFGDATTGEDMIVQHSYMSDGEYTVTLTVEDAGGSTDTDTCTVWVTF